MTCQPVVFSKNPNKCATTPSCSNRCAAALCCGNGHVLPHFVVVTDVLLHLVVHGNS